MITKNDIRKLGREIGEEFKARKVILFGSYASGRPRPDSDVDLLVILPFKGKPVWKSIEILDRVRPRFAVDILVRTPGQIKQRLKWNDFFIKEIMEKGKLIYEARN
jgi:predicted nucleotidyltransferase